MTIAEIRGKISGSGRNLTDRMEDLLTSDVFTACKYLKPNTLLLPFLSTSIDLEGKSLQFLSDLDVESVKYHFWPRLKKSEPDVLISLKLSSGKFYVLLIEAKYFSSKSSSALSEDEMSIAETPRDQLAREYEDLMESSNYLGISKSNVIGHYLIYITAHRSFQTEAMNESLNEIAYFHSSGIKINLLWTSWYSLMPIINELVNVNDWELPIIRDLANLLSRKRFIRFSGFSLSPLELIIDGELYSQNIRVSDMYSQNIPVSNMHYDFALLPESDFTSLFPYKSSNNTKGYNWDVDEEYCDSKIYSGG